VKPTGNFFGDKLKVRGVVEGICLVEAGAYEEGRLVQTIPTLKIGEFRRYEFEVTVRGGRDPEIRAYNVNGDADRYDVSSDDYGDDDYDNSFSGGWRGR
jgi:hypothetical protein